MTHQNRHKIGHSGDVLPSQSLGLVLKKLNLTQQNQIYMHNKNTVTKLNTITTARFVTSYDHWLGNATGLFYRE